MALLGLLLLLAAAGVIVDVAAQNTTAITVEAFGRSFSLSPGSLFVIGAGVALVGVVGLLLVHDGLERTRRRRAALNEERGAAEDLQLERDRLAAELEAERAGRAEGQRRAPVDLAAEEKRSEERRLSEERGLRDRQLADSSSDADQSGILARIRHR